MENSGGIFGKPLYRDCLTSSKVGNVIYQSKSLFHGIRIGRLALNFNFINM